VVAALAATPPIVGYRDRTAAYTDLVGDLLPAAILDRRSKAWFNGVIVTAEERAFARSWDGTGFDGTLVDPARLAAEWEVEHPAIGALALLQVAFLQSAPPPGR
jgi:hypothetical protein